MLQKITISILLLLTSIITNAQTQFWSDTFEDAGAPSSGTRTPSTTFYASNERYFNRVTTAQVNTTLAYTSFEGSKFFGGADIDNLTGQNTQSSHQNVTWSSINISGKTGLSFKGLFAIGNSANFDHFPGSSPIDYMLVEYRIDGGAWTNAIRFFPNIANSGAGALALETTGDSLAAGEGAALNGTFTEFTYNISGTGTLLDLRLKCGANGTSFEEVAADNFRLFETPACSNPVIGPPPTNASVCSSGNTAFTIASTGATSWQWQLNTGSGFNNIANGAPYSGVTTQTLTITGATTGMSGYLYRCIATSGACNTTSSQATLTVSNPSLTLLSQTNISCNGGSNGAASVNAASGGIPSYTYNWTPGNPIGDGTVSVTGLTTGTWTCTVTDNIGCTATATVNITQPTALSLTSNTQTNVSCFGGSNGTASVNAATGGAGGYTYNWTPGNPTGDGTVSVTGLTAGTWTCTVTDANSCTTTQTFNITAPTALVASALSQTNVSCFGGSNGAASVSVSGGTTAYSYNWTPGNPTGDGTISVTGLTVGTWTCTVTDANACTTTQIVSITQPTAITASISSTTTSCVGNTGTATISAVVGGTGAYTYSWAPSGGTTASATALGAGSYTCTITDANSCSITKTTNVTTASGPALTSASQTNISCFGGSNGSASVNTATGGTSPYTYNWTPGNPTGDGTISVTGLTAGTWTCTVTDANACTTTQTFNITQPTALVASAASQTNIFCFGGSNGAASVSVSGGTTAYSYNWTPGNPTGDGTASVTGLTAGTWTCTVTDANSCTATQTFNVTQPTALVASASSQTNISCFGGSNGAASVSVSGGTTAYSYNWTPGNPTGDGTASVTGLTAGTWTCTVTDVNSCTTTQTFTITAPTALVAAAASQTNISCFLGPNGAASVSVSGGTTAYSYNWTPGNPTGDGTASVTGLTAGTWTCTVTDANSCTTTQTFTITQPSALVATTASQTNISCNAGSNGTASVNTATGGTGPYTYNWTPGNPTGDGTISVTGLTAGTWTCTVTDVNSCTAAQTFAITQPTAIVAFNLSQTNISCNSGSNGAVSVSVSGGTTAYSYNWTPGNPTGDGTASITGVTAGTWICNVTDANGCTTTTSATVTEPALLSASSVSTAILCNGGASIITVSSTGGSPSYSGIGTFTVTAGMYSYTVTDANGCTATTNITVVEPTAITNSQTLNLCAGQSVTVGSAIYTTTGIYTDVLTAINGCDSSVTTNLTVNPAIVSSQTQTLCSGQSVTVGSNTYTTSGTFTDVLTATNGCDSTVTTNLTVNAAIVNTQNITLCAGQSLTVGLNTYATTGNYTDVLTAANGCDSTVTTNLIVNAAIVNTQSVLLCSGQSIVVGSNTYSSSGVYTDVLTAANGCDSTVTTNLTVNAQILFTQNVAVCFGGSITVGTNTYSVTGTYTDNLTAAAGCDSIVTTNLTVNNIIDVTTTLNDLIITANESAATYQWINCDNSNAIIPGETSQNFTATSNGNYAVIVSQNACSDTSACVNISNVGIKEVNSLTGIKLYPNPTNSSFTISGVELKTTISIYNIIGELIKSTQTEKNNTIIDLTDYSTGIYFIKIKNNDGEAIKKLIKE
ncbi:MAG: T9SS type A sorting domain-containing protein [Bacteroidota bacterium]|nr:T9SS type A sorting domain-containing protein [Bacteroidota bacterium]